MENFITLFIATLEKLELLTEKEAKKIATELRNSTIPSSYEEAKQIVEDVFSKVKNK